MPKSVQENVELLHLNLLQKAIQKILAKQLRQASQIINRAGFIRPQDADTYFIGSLCSFKQCKLSKLKMMREQAINSNPLCQIYQLPCKQACQKLKQLVKRSKQFEQQIGQKKNELDVKLWYNYTILLHEYTNFQKAEAVYRRLFDKFPEIKKQKSHAFLGNYSNLLFDMGKYKQAIVNYELEITRDPSQVRFFSNCSILYTNIGNYEKAQEYIKIALARMPNRHNFLFNYSNILSKTGRHKQSLTIIEQIIKQDSTDPIINIKFAITAYLNQLQVDSSLLQSLEKSIMILNECICSNNTDKANCNKRMLSMKNIKCIKLFVQLLIQVFQLEKLRVRWDFKMEFLELVCDYFIVGQADKIKLNLIIIQKIKQLIQLVVQIDTPTLNQQQDESKQSYHEENIAKLQNIKSEIASKKKQTLQEMLQKLQKICKNQQTWKTIDIVA